MKRSEKHKNAPAYTILRPANSHKGARIMGVMAQAMLKVKRPSCPMISGTPNSSHIRPIPELYAVVARPMNKVIRFRRVVMNLLYQGFQLKGFSLSPVAKESTM